MDAFLKVCVIDEIKTEYIRAYRHADAGSCAAGRCEPCQAGNRAALSGLPCAPQSIWCPYDDVHEGSVLFYCPRFVRGLQFIRE